jgi:hypothetical protein
MAKITPGALAGQISGAAGTIVFARNRYGSYFRVRAVPVKPATGYQTDVRTALIKCSKAWAGLTNAQRLMWAAWADQNPITDSLGFAHHLSGHACFVKLNARLARAFPLVALLSTPSQIPAPDPLTSITLTGDTGAGTCEIAYTPTPLPLACALMVWAVKLNRDSIRFDKNLYKNIYMSASAAVSPFDYESAMSARFGALVIGNFVRVYCNVFHGATGLISPPVRAAVTVTST